MSEDVRRDYSPPDPPRCAECGRDAGHRGHDPDCTVGEAAITRSIEQAVHEHLARANPDLGVVIDPEQWPLLRRLDDDE